MVVYQSDCRMKSHVHMTICLVGKLKKNELVSTDYTSKVVFWMRKPNESKIEVHFDWFCRTSSLKLFHSSRTQPLVAQLARAWQAIFQVAGSSPSLNHCRFPLFLSHLYFSPSFSMTLTRSDCQVWSMFMTEPAPSCQVCTRY